MKAKKLTKAQSEALRTALQHSVSYSHQATGRALSRDGWALYYHPGPITPTAEGAVAYAQSDIFFRSEIHYSLINQWHAEALEENLDRAGASIPAGTRVRYYLREHNRIVSFGTVIDPRTWERDPRMVRIRREIPAGPPVWDNVRGRFVTLAD